jgi:hypothetical protein
MFRDRTRNPDYNPNATRSDGLPDVTSGVLAGDHDGGHTSRLLHERCNKARGDGSRDDQRPALNHQQALSPLGDLTMGWPT